MWMFLWWQYQYYVCFVGVSELYMTSETGSSTCPYTQSGGRVRICHHLSLICQQYTQWNCSPLFFWLSFAGNLCLLLHSSFCAILSKHTDQIIIYITFWQTIEKILMLLIMLMWGKCNLRSGIIVSKTAKLKLKVISFGSVSDRLGFVHYEYALEECHLKSIPSQEAIRHETRWMETGSFITKILPSI